MRPILLLIALSIVVLLGVGIVVLGAFPPKPTQQDVQHVLPNDRFQSR